jgi:phenylalanine-4-hydroxylase
MSTSSGLTEQIPEYLAPYIVQQDPSLYTPMDHAAWRFILKISRAFFSRYAHQKYLDGLRETGISAERIPLIEEMDQCLRKFGWRAVAVSGFIPPGVFMEFQALGILPIACDMRKLEHLAYTPAPDIVHEAAGHAPIIADPAFSDYLRSYGELARKAIFSSQDMDVYLAILNLSDTKENPTATPEQVDAAQKQLDGAIAAVTFVSEATLLGRMGWWTFEYGLIGDLREPKIYGAGLLSSVGESFHCLGPEVKKVPFSVDCIHTNFDITRPQPQLFVARDFQQLKDGLEELSKTMAFRHGGIKGLKKALEAVTVTTTVFDSGLQISGMLTQIIWDTPEAPAYLKYTGPTQLAYQDQELSRQGADYHREGFGTPIGLVKGLAKSSADLSDADLANLGFYTSFRDSKPGRIEFESGVVVEGILKTKIRREGRNLVLAFEECTVRKGTELLFQPDWGTFDMGCGLGVTSVFGGAADRRKYLAATGGFHQEPRVPKTNLTEENRALNALYAKVREIRESDTARARTAELSAIHEQLETEFGDDWLLRFELLELNGTTKLRALWERSIRQRLEVIGRGSKEKSELIARGLALL